MPGADRSPCLARFEGFELDVRAGELREEDGAPVRLPEQSLRILVLLLEHPGEVVQREEIRQKLWPNGTIVEFEHSISAAINRLRQALGDSAEEPRYLETLARRGYRWMVAVEWVEGRPGLTPGAVAEKKAAESSDGRLIGRKVSHYRVLQILGGGGMGIVYEAEDLKLGRRVALKFLPEELGNDPRAVERFEREARAASALDHPNICPIHEFGEHEGQPFIVMPLLRGQTLRERIATGDRFALDEILNIAIQIVEGLDAAHQKGIIHRDIKPANIFITDRGEAKILDFGLAKVLAYVEQSDVASENGHEPTVLPTRHTSSHDLHLTRTGLAMGTAAYMSPEQVRGEKLDARTDLFSFGLVLYEMATGRQAFHGNTAAELHAAILNGTQSPVRELNPQIPSKMEEVIAKALEKDRNLRYQHASEMRADFDHLRRELEPRSPVARWRELAAGTVAVLLIASATFWFAKRRPTSPQSPPELKLRQLTSNSAENDVISGTISPDGKYLAYSDVTGMHIQNIESGEHQDVRQPEVLKGDKAEWEVGFWSPNSTRFFANAHRPGQNRGSWNSQGTSIWAVSVLGGTPQKLRDDANGSTISPDGYSVSFGTNKGRFGDREIWLMDPSGEHARRLLDPDQESSIMQLNWSLNSKRVIYQKTDSSGITMLSRDLEGGSSTTILSSSEAAGLRDYAWLPDGRLIYTKAEADAVGTGDSTCNFWQMRLDASAGKPIEKPTRLTTWPGFCNSYLSATADGKRLVFLKGALHLTTYLADLEANETRIANTKHFTLTASMDGPSDWTADSKTIILTSNRTGHFGIYKQALNEQTARPLVTGQSNLYMARVSADGNWVIYLRDIKPEDQYPHREILRVPITGGAPEVISTTGPNGFVLCARATSNLCAIAEWTEDLKQLVVTAVDPVNGRGPEMTRFALDPTDNSWAQVGLSPDGTRIAAIRSPEGPIHILSLRGQASHKFTLKGWNNLQSLSWDAEGTGLFVSNGIQRGVVLLHVDLQGNAQVLWKNHGYNSTTALPSPDGRHLAILGSTWEGNMWMMQNF
jgi:serine/threonine protein kinase